MSRAQSMTPFTMRDSCMAFAVPTSIIALVVAAAAWEKEEGLLEKAKDSRQIKGSLIIF